MSIKDYKGKGTNKPTSSPNDAASNDRLAAYGIQIGANGEVTGNPFQGHNVPASGGPDRISPEDGEGEGPANPFNALEVDEPESPALPEESAEEEEGSSIEPKPDDAKLKGLEKREADARAAQAAMSKTEARLKLLETTLNHRQEELEEQIQRLSALQVASGPIPSNLNPADEATMEEWRRDQPESIQVIEAVVAPAFAAIGKIQEQMNGLIQRMGDFFSRQKSEEVNSGIYSKVPKERVDAIVESPEFVDWLSNKPRTIKSTYLDILTRTSDHTADDALEVLKEFARDTNTELGLAGSPSPAPRRPEMDRAPALRSGSALPPAPQEPPRRPANPGLTPLSPPELANISRLLSEGTVEQRDAYRKRLELTQLDVSGWANR